MICFTTAVFPASGAIATTRIVVDDTLTFTATQITPIAVAWAGCCTANPVFYDIALTLLGDSRRSFAVGQVALPCTIASLRNARALNIVHTIVDKSITCGRVAVSIGIVVAARAFNFAT